MSELPLRLRPMTVADLDLVRRVATEPELVGTSWYGFRDPDAARKRLDTDGFIGPDDGRLMLDLAGTTAGFVAWHQRSLTFGRYWVIGIIVMPECRRQGIASRAQAMLADYLFQHTPVDRIEALTQPDNVGEQKALIRAGYTHEGVLRGAEFRDGTWRDIWIYSRLRHDRP